MGGLLSAPKPPPVVQPPPIPEPVVQPDPDDKGVERAAARKFAAKRRKSGRLSTINTDTPAVTSLGGSGYA